MTLFTALNNSGASRAHHDHSLSVIKLSSRCFIITLRDPVERVESALATGKLKSNWLPKFLTGGSGLHANNMLVPQTEYLRGINCSRMELHVLCTCSLGSDWAALRKKFGPLDWGGGVRDLPHEHGRRFRNPRAPRANETEAAALRRIFRADWEWQQSWCQCVNGAVHVL